jgi:HK97 family phage portal protein
MKAELLTADQLAVVGSMALMRERKQLAVKPADSGSFRVPVGSPMSSLLSGLHASGGWGYAQDANKLQRLAAYTGYVHTCVSTRATRDAKAKFMLFDAKDPKAPVPEDHLPVPYAFFRRPNPVMSEYQLSMLVRIWLMLCGTAPLWKIRNAAGAPVMAWPLLPNRVRALYDPESWVRYEYTDDGGRVVHIPASEMIYIRKPHPTKMFDGLGDLEGAGLFHDTDQLLWAFQRELFDKGPFTSWVLQYPEAVHLSPDQAQVIADGFEDVVKDRNNVSFPVVLDQGVEAKSFPVTNKGLEVPTINEEIKERIRCAFGTSKSILGEVEMASRANNEGAEISYSKRSEADNQLIADCYQADLLPDYGNGDRLKGRYEVLAPEDKEFALRQASAMVTAGAMTVNEWRGEAGMTPIDGGDALAGNAAALPKDGTQDDDEPMPQALESVGADVQAQAFTGIQTEALIGITEKVASGAMSKATAAALIAMAYPAVLPEQIAALLDGIVVKEPAPEPSPPPAKPEPEPAKMSWAKIDVPNPDGFTMSSDPAEIRLAKSKAFIAFQGKHEAKILAALQPILAAECKAIIARVEKYVPKTMSDIAGCRDKKHARMILADNPPLKKIVDMDEFADEYQKLTPDLGTLYAEAGKRAASEFGVTFHVDARGITKIANHLHRSTDSILKTTSEQIRAALEEGFLQGEGVEALSQRVRDLYDGISRGRALTIARTETVAPANDGAWQGYKQAGVDKEWIPTMDGHARDTHEAMAGVVIGIDEEFTVGKDKMLYPGGGEEPEENIN